MVNTRRTRAVFSRRASLSPPLWVSMRPRTPSRLTPTGAPCGRSPASPLSYCTHILPYYNNSVKYIYILFTIFFIIIFLRCSLYMRAFAFCICNHCHGFIIDVVRRVFPVVVYLYTRAAFARCAPVYGVILISLYFSIFCPWSAARGRRGICPRFLCFCSLCACPIALFFARILSPYPFDSIIIFCYRGYSPATLQNIKKPSPALF